MAVVYMNNSSRRFPELPHSEMEKLWEEQIGKPAGAVCNECGEKSKDNKLVNGLCRECRDSNKLKEHDYIIVDSSTDKLDPTADNGESSGEHQNDY